VVKISGKGLARVWSSELWLQEDFIPSSGLEEELYGMVYLLMMVKAR